MRLADYPRSLNRSLIDRLANGQPPLTESERVSQNAYSNINDLSLPKLLGDARRTYDGAHRKPGVFFNVTLDYGDPIKAASYGKIITREINKILRKSKAYFELHRSTFAMVVEHGIAPAHWQDNNKWCPKSTAIADVLIPSNTLLTMENLPYFAIFHQYTAAELYKLTRSKKLNKKGKPMVDPGWKMPMVDAAIKWAMSEEIGTAAFNPEKWEDAIKENPGYYGSDAVPTINCWRFFYWSDEAGVEGWRQRMVLDTPPPAQINPNEASPKIPDKNGIGEDRGRWLYCPNSKRVYASKLDEIIHFQFGDASAVAPFKYHTVRSLGWLLYAVCHLQNRLRNKINDATFQSLIPLLRNTGGEDGARVLKVDFHNFGIVPDSISFIPANERFEINTDLVQLTTGENRNSMNEAAAQFREGRDSGKTQQTAKTATQVMAEVNAANALVGAMILQSYTYKEFQDQEVCRRFCNPKSTDADVMRFRVNVLKAGVPPKCLNSSLWNITAERAMGSGNKILQVAMADKLMAIRPQLDPQAQRLLDHIYVEANSDSPAVADMLVPPTPALGNSVQLAVNMIGSLMYGIQIPIAPGLNGQEVVETLLGGLATVLKGMVQPDIQDINGAKNVAQHIGMWIKKLSEDKAMGDKVKEYGKDLAELVRVIDQMEAQLAQEQPQPQGDPAQQAKADSIIQLSQVKGQIMEQTAQQKLAHKDAAFQQKTAQSDEKLRAGLQGDLTRLQVDNAKADLEAAAEIKRKDLMAESAPPKTA